MRSSSAVRPSSPGASKPLEGVSIQVNGEDSKSLDFAATILVGLGATTSQGRAGQRPDLILGAAESAAGPSTGLVSTTAPEAPGLPEGTLDYALGLTLVAAGAAALLSGTRYEVDARAVSAQLFLPQVMAVAYGAPPPAAPPAPVPTGRGALYCELQSDDDRDLFERFTSSWPLATHAAAELARRAQEAGLAIFDFRTPRAAGRARPMFYALEVERSLRSRLAADQAGSDGGPLAGIRVCDLTAMWAGPLATWLLATLGAEVVKIEPRIRLDGFRALDGGGIYPNGTAVPGDGDRSAVFNALNRNKTRLDLDLRDEAQRRQFFRTVAGADLVIHNFSPRVVENLEIGRDELTGSRPSRLVSLAMPGFPIASPERNWRAYGGGVHAVSGLAETDGGDWYVPSVAYPDALSGLAAAAISIVLLLAVRRGSSGWEAEVPLLNVTSQLRRFGGGAPSGHRDYTPIQKLVSSEVFSPLADGAGRHRYPTAPFRGAGVPMRDEPAPVIGSVGR